MSQPIHLSDELLSEARRIAELSERSVSGQIEFWALLGRTLEPLLADDRVSAFRQTGRDRPLSEAIREVTTEHGQRRVGEYLDSRPYPRFEAVPDSPDRLRKIEEDGTVTVGKFVNRVFVPDES